jgi:hypothetical protein
VLYELVERHYPEFVSVREAAGRPLPRYVQDEFEAYLKCGRLEHGFLRVRCAKAFSPAMPKAVISSSPPTPAAHSMICLATRSRTEWR